MDRTIFADLDLWVILYAAGMAIIASLITTFRRRNAERLHGTPLSPFATVLPDTAAGLAVGVAAAVIGPRLFPALANFTGVSILAGGGGILGPAIWDLISSRGLKGLLFALGNTAAGPLAKFLAQQQKEGANDDAQKDPPAPQ